MPHFNWWVVSEMSLIKGLGSSLLAVFLAIVIYFGVSVLWVPFGGISGGQLHLELPILLLTSYALLGGRKHQSKWHLITLLITLLLPYACFDGFYQNLDREPRVSDFGNIGDLMLVGGIYLYGSLLIIGLWFSSIVFCVYSSFFREPGSTPKSVFTSSIIALVVCYGLSVGLPPKFNTQLFPKWVSWSDDRNTRRYGRVSSMLVAQGRRHDNFKKLKDVGEPTVWPDFNIESAGPLANISIIVLESLMDPRLIEGAEFDISPLHPDLVRWLNAGQFDRIKVPVYGGGTPQTEFELLTGAPALAAYGRIEHNNFGGSKIPGFINALNKVGYSVEATIATSPRFYNSTLAYQSHGFSDVCFIDRCEGFDSKPPYRYLHDEDLLEVVAEQSTRSSHQPLVRYVLGMFGHTDYERHKSIRPDAVTVQGALANHEAFVRLSNQFYYRSKAIADFLQQTHHQAGRSITLIVGDHLPPILSEDVRYLHDKHESIALLIDGDRRIDIAGMAAWQLPHLLASLADGRPVALPSRDQMSHYYHYLLKSSMSSY